MIYKTLSDNIIPITAQPFKSGYREYSPCEALKPYIRCFWTGSNQTDRLVIPDLCADIIYDIDSNTAFFSGISDAPFVSDRSTDIFGIRFYAWTSALFAEDSMSKTLNGCFELEGIFSKLKNDLIPKLSYAKSTEERIALSEKFLVNYLKDRHNDIFTEAVGRIITLRGLCTAEELAKEMHISKRQLERVFSDYSGLSPKKTAILIRYQSVWRDILSEENFHAADKALEFGYNDQSHLLNDFRRFHTVTPKRAREIALKDVAFLQDACSAK